MTKSYLHSFYIFIIQVVFVTTPSLGELPEGRWIHHERQAPQYDITGIFSGKSYKIWVSTKKTLHAFDGTRWRKFTFDDQSLRDHTPFYHDGNGRFFFEDGGDLLVLEDGIITQYTDEEIHFPVVAASGSDGIVYLGLYDIITGGVYAFDGDSVKKIREGRTRSIAMDASGRIWATILNPDSDSMRLMIMEGNEWSDHSDEIASILPAETNELTVQVAPDGAVWVNNLGRYGIFSEGGWTFHDGGSEPMFLNFDSSGGVWGYKNRNMYRLDESGNWEFSRYIEKGIPNSPNFLAEDSDGTVWIFDSYRIFEFTDSEWVVWENNLDLASDIVTCMVFTEDGTLMCGHGLRGIDEAEKKNHGISVWDGTGWHNFNMAGTIFLHNVYLLKYSPDDEIIAHTDHGLKVYDGTFWSTIDTLKALDVADVIWDERAVMWIASYNGLIEYNDPDVDFKVNPKWLYPWKVFYNLNFDPEGVLYMQTNYGAIVSYSEDREETWLSHASNTIYDMDIAIDKEGKLWCARQYSLSWWDKYEGWQNVVELYGGRMVEIDEQGRIWASGYVTTGYFEDGVWHSIPELSQYASDEFASDGRGRFALNAFEVDMYADPPERTPFYGLFEYVPGPEKVTNEGKPEPIITAANYPNPFNPATTIQFSLPEPGSVTVTVYNVNGQKVRTLASGSFHAGENSVSWNSISDDGRPAASGIYVYRIEAGDMVKTGKMLLIR